MQLDVTTAGAPPMAGAALPPLQDVDTFASQVHVAGQSLAVEHVVCLGMQDLVSRVTVVHSGTVVVVVVTAVVPPETGMATSDEAPPDATAPLESVEPLPEVAVPDEPLHASATSATQSNPSPQSLAAVQGNVHWGTQAVSEQTMPLAQSASAVQFASGAHSKVGAGMAQSQAAFAAQAQALGSSDCWQEKPLSQSASVAQLAADA